ncbi:apoptosis-associated speck-like protein containing a CARD [Pimephales promelas]|nr:apoptosis-associated speck-like protein containing a CARD [Pimephales promelas]KAG1933483.1 apoptosis-associated speck-like protein containing a CARD [Pimephales promelas]
MPIVDELNSKGMIHAETYAEIRAERTNQEKMRKLFEALEAGGDRVKYEFYHALKIHEQFLFRDLGGGTENTAGDNREQNLSERMQLQ